MPSRYTYHTLFLDAVLFEWTLCCTTVRFAPASPRWGFLACASRTGGPVHSGSVYYIVCILILRASWRLLVFDVCFGCMIGSWTLLMY